MSAGTTPAVRAEPDALWRRMGAHPDVAGGPTRFRVWAPAAEAVDLVWWHPGVRPVQEAMTRSADGCWDTVVPRARPGVHYRFQVHGRDGTVRHKADPWAREVVPGEPHTSVVPAPSRHRWTDADWLAGRPRRHAPVSVYEVHAGSWRPGAGFRRLADDLVPYVRRHGFTHVELMPVTEHPYGGSWGYQVSSYFAPSARFGGADELRHLIDRLHAAGVGVLLDWVPAHFAPDDWSLADFDGGALYEPPDPDRAWHPLWGTKTFDYQRPQVRDFLVASALYWLEEFHFDGLRVDAVSSITRRDFLREPGGWAGGDVLDRPGIDFLRELTGAVRRRHPGALLIAEEAGLTDGVTEPVDAGGLGFDLCWDLGWAHDTFTYFAAGPDQRPHLRETLAAAVDRAAARPVVLPVSHDEITAPHEPLWRRVHGDGPDAAAALRALLALQYATPGVPLLFMGAEHGGAEPWREWAPVDPSPLLDAPGGELYRGVGRLVTRLNRICQQVAAGPEPVRWWRRPGPGEPLLAFARDHGDGVLLCVANLTDRPLGWDAVADPREWSVLLDTADERYGGAGRPAGAGIAPGAVVWLTAARTNLAPTMPG
ncbi:alpha-amylase family glycosyl hydrolase [Micromonospora sp. NPDC048898]|uniref:alpha-amylase family glycosyl hydrolase n=1 Tax=Micromonospora sp. NPDC048898 TaxID=3364260 RepID=UPI00370FDE30